MGKPELTPLTIASGLHAVELEIARLEEAKEKYRKELLISLKKQGVKQVKLENGDTYTVYDRNVLDIKNELSARKWALENPEARMSLDKSKLTEVVKMGGVKFAKIKVEQSLRINRAKELPDKE